MIFFCISLLLQHLAGVYKSDLNGDRDAPGHYITGLMVHDWIQQGFPLPPTSFAENYYAHYPKVTIGHWPPVFYVAQAAWMFAFGDSIHSDLWFMALLDALFATTLYAVVWREFGSWLVALAVGFLLLLTPCVQISSSTVMADLVVALFCQWAVLAWVMYLDQGRARDILAFAVLSSLAIMTKGNGYALLLVPPISIALARSWRVLRDRKLWACGALIFIACIPWTLMTRDLVVSTWQYKLTPAFFVKALTFYAGQLMVESSLAAGLFALIGLVVVVAFRHSMKALWPVAASWVLAFLFFHALIPAGLERRYTVLVLPIWLLLMTKGVSEVIRRFPLPRVSPSTRAMGLAALIAVVFLTTAFSIQSHQPSAFVAVGKALALEPAYANRVILISSEGEGEGALISELVQWDKPRPKHIVLRAGRVLADSDWMQRNYTLRYHTPEEVLRYIRSIPIGILVVDRTSRDTPNLHQQLIDQMLDEYPRTWKLSAAYPANSSISRAVAVYQLADKDTIPHKPIRVELNGTLHLNILVKP